MQCPKENDDGDSISQVAKARNSCSDPSNRSIELRQNGLGKESQLKTTGQSSKLLEPDGRKVANLSALHSSEDMSQASVRRSTFEKFPKKHLLSRILDSGYFYCGEDDKTECHSCHATVQDWNEKDDPASFHEAYCNYHHAAEAMDEDRKLSLERTSLLDIPITDACSFSPPPVLLQPTKAPTSPRNIRKRSPHSIPLMTEEILQNHSGPQYQSLPAVGTSKFYGGVAPPVAKQLFQPGEVIEKEHETFLKTINLFIEADRRKTFSINDCWQMNTNNVLPYEKLAEDGFFYLGNLDRTKCFSCRRVFNNWQRKDKIRNVHRRAVPTCRMVNGTEIQNVPSQNLLTIKEPSLPIKQLLSENSSASSICDSNESALEISQFPLPTYGSNDELPQNTMSGSSDLNEASSFVVNQPPGITVPGHILDPNHPVHSTTEQSPWSFGQKEPVSLPHSTASGSLPDPSESSVRVSVPSTQNMVTTGSFPQCHSPIPAIQEEILPNEMPLDLTTRQNAHITENTGTPSGSGHEDPSLEGQSTSLAMEQDHYPVQVSMGDNEEQSGPIDRPETAAPSRLGQTTLYIGTSGSETTPHGIISSNREIFSFPNAPPGAQGEWAEAFPCLEPDAAHMRSTIARQETFDYSWAARGISFTDEMARAGFYSIGDGDRVNCWYCGGCAHHWTPQDDPWEEHAKLYPNCEYLLQQKGLEYVTEVSSRLRAARPPTPVPRFRRSPSVASNSSESPFSSLEEVSACPFRGPYFSRSPLRMFPHRAPSPPRFVDPREQEARRKQMIDAALNSEQTLAAVNMGFDLKIIKKAIKQKVRSTDSPFSSLEALLDAILNLTGDSDSSDSENEAPPTSNVPGTSTSIMEVTGTSSPTNPVGGQGGEPRPQTSSLEGAEDLDPKKLEGRLREYEQEKRCKVCLDRDAEVVFVPCGHLCTCVQCANALRTCPLCRKRIQTAMKIYTS